MNNKFRINSFDLTVCKDQTTINNKIKKMKSMLEDIFKNYYGTKDG